VDSNIFALLPLAVTFLIFPCIAWLVLRLAPQRVRMPAFALLNVGLALLLTAVAASKDMRRTQVREFVPVGIVFGAIYILLVALQYVNLVWGRRDSRRSAAIGVIYPLALLVLIKYLPPAWDPLQSLLHGLPGKYAPEFFLGISYMSFRLTHMVYEIRNGTAESPTFWEFLSFAFFVPTFSIGPINPFSRFQKSLASSVPVAPAGQALLRILVGAAKYLVLANVVNQLSYRGLMLDRHPHAGVDLIVAVFAFALFLYFNFSGFCDMAIGISALLGISVMENFNDPFVSRNIQEFWNRWHITLSTWIRDLMFTPLSKTLIRKFGPRSANNAIAFSIFAVFIVLGVWHGVGWNFVLFGMWHGIGLAICHYYTVFLKRRLGKQGYARYLENRWIEAAGVFATIVFFSCGLFLLANSMSQMRQIFQSLV
jgi:D-alanyl-lipoteichoic acid acyltransferase DltB (MBOAT superfamily)